MNKLRVAIVGCGYWGQNLVRNFSELDEVELAAVSDFDLNALARTKRRHPAVSLKHNYKDVISDPRIDAVVIATPVSTHYPFARQALLAGKHVLVEKPLATSTEHVLDLIDLAEGRNRVLMVDHTFLYTAAVRRMRSLIDAGEVGDLLYFDSVRISLGLVQSDINVIWDLAPHDFAIMDYLCDSKPVAISATGMKHLNCPFENIAYVTAHFEGCMIAHFHVNWLAPVKVRRTMVGGSKKMIVYDDMVASEKVRVYDSGVNFTDDPQEIYQRLVGYRTGDMWAPKLDTTEALRVGSKHFVECIETGAMPVTDGRLGLRVVEVIEAATASMRGRGETVHIQRQGSGS